MTFTNTGQLGCVFRVSICEYLHYDCAVSACMLDGMQCHCDFEFKLGYLVLKNIIQFHSRGLAAFMYSRFLTLYLLYFGIQELHRLSVHCSRIIQELFGTKNKNIWLQNFKFENIRSFSKLLNWAYVDKHISIAAHQMMETSVFCSSPPAAKCHCIRFNWTLVLFGPHIHQWNCVVLGDGFSFNFMTYMQNVWYLYGPFAHTESHMHTHTYFPKKHRTRFALYVMANDNACQTLVIRMISRRNRIIKQWR